MARKLVSSKIFRHRLFRQYLQSAAFAWYKTTLYSTTRFVLKYEPVTQTKNHRLRALSNGPIVRHTECDVRDDPILRAKTDLSDLQWAQFSYMTYILIIKISHVTWISLAYIYFLSSLSFSVYSNLAYVTFILYLFIFFLAPVEGMRCKPKYRAL